MGIKVASSAIEFAFGNYSLKILDLELKTVSIIGNFFTHCGRCGTLPVSTAHHGYIGKLVSDICKFALKRFQ